MAHGVVSPPNTLCVTALLCKFLITTIAMCFYVFTTINNNKYELECVANPSLMAARPLNRLIDASN